jgi:AbrB family looped-hinge helix DNA binding protein
MPRQGKKNQAVEYLTKGEPGSKVREAALAYSVSPEEGPPVTTISSKNQITLPAHLLREMGLGPGDRLAVGREDNRLVLRPRPRDWVRHYAGSLSGLYGGTRQQADRYLKDLREEGARAQEIERAWAGGAHSAKE